MKILLVESIIRHKLCIIYAFFDYFFPKSFFTKNHFLIAAINLTTRGPLYTCFVYVLGCTMDENSLCPELFETKARIIKSEKSVKFWKLHILWFFFCFLLVEFKALAEQETIHHMLVFTCRKPHTATSLSW